MTSKKNIYFLVPYPISQAPSQRFRFEQYIDIFEKANYNVLVFPFLNEKTWKLLYKKGHYFKKAISIVFSLIKRFGVLFKLRDADYIFIHREAAHIGPPIFEWIIARVLKKKYIYDFDDAIWLANYSETNAKFQKLKAYWKVNFCMKWAYKVVAGNEYLSNYAKKYNDNVTIIPTTIDTENHHNILSNQMSHHPVIGWTGTHTTMHYLDRIIPVIKELEHKYNFTFIVISNLSPIYDLKSLKYVPWSKKSEIEDLSQINIGLMPLVEDQWSQGKCGFKGLQYMALEIATIMSPVGVNTSIIEHGKNGYLANGLDEWKDQLICLLENPELRIQLGKAGRNTIVERYSVNAMKSNYLNLFQSNV